MIAPIPKHVCVDRDILLLQGSVAFVELAVCQLLRHAALDAVVLNAHDLVQHAAL